MIIISQKYTNIAKKAGNKIHAPQQRLIVGITALATQPVIDLSNKKVDEDTRVLAACRSLGKIIACTFSGVVVRSGCIKFCERLKDKAAMQKVLIGAKATKMEITKFSNFMGATAALGVMLFTNFLWDAPVTQKLTNFFYNLVSGKKEAKNG